MQISTREVKLLLSGGGCAKFGGSNGDSIELNQNLESGFRIPGIMLPFFPVAGGRACGTKVSMVTQILADSVGEVYLMLRHELV